MDVKIIDTIYKKIKLYLVFFCIPCFFGCAESAEIESVSVNYVDGKAAHISFTSNSNTEEYSIYVQGTTETPVIGEFSELNGKNIFTPVIPFSKGQSYELKKNGKFITGFFIDEKKSKAPELLVVYPTRDTVPENLLKMYFVFSKPMQELGNTLDFIKVHNVTDDRPESIFLPLETELWNKEHTQLTLWLDPGRIKRDLIPNKEKGLPIEAGKEYLVQVGTDFKDADGISLATGYSKKIYVAARDAKKPTVEGWELSIPKEGTNEALRIDFKEPLDAILAKESIAIYTTSTNDLVQGNFKLMPYEQQLAFYPDAHWVKGDYYIEAASRLEDLAGNNLNHLFDKDITNTVQVASTAFKTITFKIYPVSE